MQTPENLDPNEARGIENKIKSALFEAEMGSHSYVSPDADPALLEIFFANVRDIEAKFIQPPVSVFSILGEEGLPDTAEFADEIEAEAAVAEILQRLANGNVFIDRPYHLTATEYYRWLKDEFSEQEVDFPLGDGWNANYSYAEMVPESPENMFSTLQMFLDSLFRLDFPIQSWMLTDAVYQDMHCTPAPDQGKYLNAWRASWVDVMLIELIPFGPRSQTDTQAVFDFELSYRTTDESGRTTEFTGPGTVYLRFSNPYWDVKSLSFPGCDLAAETEHPTYRSNH